MGHADLGQPDFGHLPLVAQLLQHTELVVGGNVGIDPMQLEEVDPLDAQPPETAFALLAEVLGAAARGPTPPGPAG